MLMNTHILIAQNILKDVEVDFKISEKNFIYGNVKPDMVSKYKLKKHYLDESFNMIVSKIKKLASLTMYDFKKKFSVSRFNQELGVICHFVCDFFCIPHSERWEFKHSMNKHVKYEKKLAAFAKTYSPCKYQYDIWGNMSVEKFLKEAHKAYKMNESYANDIQYAYFACKSVIKYINDSIVVNTKAAYINAIA
ncbi:zinc dependent phospholipase C family protein [Clostridium sp.]|uniref:zinc dependent phospholipase C family protein n=1 Tax=Clostridium sp. TaxID=1506 RepID=UPI002628EF6C|nr:zinc dependent phospholipase C family protein [Clostridium sp.]